MFKLTLLSVAAFAASIVSAETAYFAFKTFDSNEFIFELTDDAKIAQARRILSGEETDVVHVYGRILKEKASYNPYWEFQFDTKTINFFDHALEVCDATVDYVEDHLDEACGAFLPGCLYCPWSSKLTREVKL